MDARRGRATADAAEAEVLAQALAWAQLHEVSESECFASWGGSPVPIAGQGAPLASEFCLHELGELDVADALDLDKALQAGAEQLADLGSEESLDVRRPPRPRRPAPRLPDTPAGRRACRDDTPADTASSARTASSPLSRSPPGAVPLSPR